MMRDNNNAPVVNNGANANVEEIVELIKSTLYMELRQRFEVSEVKQLYESIDRAVKTIGGGIMMREKLIDLLKGSPLGVDELSLGHIVHRRTVGNIADNLIANGVIVKEQGHWTIKTDDYDCEYMVCSCCGEEFYNADEDTVDRTPKYCPNCGAKMDSEREGE